MGIGPGLGQVEITAIAMISQIRRTQCPIVVDADALNMLASHRAWLQQLPKKIIMTPHAAEFDRLNGTPSIGEYERLEQAQQLAQNLDAFILLKGIIVRFVCQMEIFFLTLQGIVEWQRLVVVMCFLEL